MVDPKIFLLIANSLTFYVLFNAKFSQKLNPNPRPVPTRAAIQHGNYFKSLGWTTSTKEIVEKKVRDITFMRKLFLKNQLGVSVKANKLQKHFRRQVDM